MSNPSQVVSEAVLICTLQLLCVQRLSKLFVHPSITCPYSVGHCLCFLPTDSSLHIHIYSTFMQVIFCGKVIATCPPHKIPSQNRVAGHSFNRTHYQINPFIHKAHLPRYVFQIEPLLMLYVYRVSWPLSLLPLLLLYRKCIVS